MDPSTKSKVGALETGLENEVDSYKTLLSQPADTTLDQLQGDVEGLPGKVSSSLKTLTEQFGAIDPAAIGKTGQEFAGSILPDLVGGAADGFAGHWVIVLLAVVVLWITRLIFISFVGTIDYRGFISLGTPGGLKYIVIACGIFGIAGYYAHAAKQAERSPTAHVTSKSLHFR